MSKQTRHEYARHRLYVDESLCQGQVVPLDQGQAHYLFNVLRRGQGDRLVLFNGRDGEWGATITQAGKKKGVAVVETLLRAQITEPDIWLLFAPLKKGPMEILVEKSVELGVARLCPVITQYTNAPKLNLPRLRAQVIEAAEQCERLCVPDVAAARSLSDWLGDWPQDRALVFANEDRPPDGAHLIAGATVPAAILIGPEGGFAPDEITRIESMAQARPISLGPRVLRAETAAIAALALWQSQMGDWT